MAKEDESSYQVKATEAPNPTRHLQVREGQTAYYQGKAYGDRATLQVHQDEAPGLLKSGAVEEVDPNEVPDVSERPNRPGEGSRRA